MDFAFCIGTNAPFLTIWNLFNFRRNPDKFKGYDQDLTNAQTTDVGMDPKNMMSLILWSALRLG